MTPLRSAWLYPAALLSGLLTVGAFAPYALWPLALCGPLLLFPLWQRTDPRQAFLLGWCYGLGMLGVGVFWMHISIDQFGNVGTLTAILFTLLFVTAMALYYGVVGWLAARLRGPGGVAPLVLLFPSLWVLGEWLRGWVLTGFPWLSLGYSQIDSPLAGFAPLLGVFGLSWLLLVSAGLLLVLWTGERRQRVFALVGLLSIWLSGQLLLGEQWTRPAGEPLRVSMIQGNVPQEAKWKKDNLAPTLRLFTRHTRKHWSSDLIIWPETAVPAFAHLVEEPLLQPLEMEAALNRSEILMGIPVWKEGGRYFNAMLLLGSKRQHYYKRHLVPFGEFMPLKSLLAPLLSWMEIPMSDFTPGDSARPLMRVAGYLAGISICYEDAFGAEVIQALPDAAFLINVSNDAWFGDSLAPPQHLEIARMRALETGRYLLRSTNTGVSALIGPDGGLQGTSPAFQEHVLSGEIQPLQGMTPYATMGNGTVVVIALVLALAGLLFSRRGGQS